MTTSQKSKQLHKSTKSQFAGIIQWFPEITMCICMYDLSRHGCFDDLRCKSKSYEVYQLNNDKGGDFGTGPLGIFDLYQFGFQAEQGLHLTVDLVHFGPRYAELAADLLEENLYCKGQQKVAKQGKDSRASP